MHKVLIVAECYPFPEYRNGLAKINANLLAKNPHFDAEILCVADPAPADCTRESIHLLARLPESKKLAHALRYMAGRAPMGPLKAKPYFDGMASFIIDNHERFDVIHLSSAYLAGLVDYLPKAVISKTILFAIDSLSLFWSRRAEAEQNPVKRLVYHEEFRRNLRHERKFYPRFDKVVFVSPVDAAFASKNAPGAICVSIPNGVDIEYFGVVEEGSSKTNALVFTGDLSYEPNYDAANFLVDEVLPLIPKELSAHLYLVGQRPPQRLTDLALPNVTVTGFVDDLRPYLGNATLYVSPLRFGAGIKNKVLEAMSMGRVVVGTPVSFEGIDCQDGRDCILAGVSAHEFAAGITRALLDRKNCAQLGVNARSLIEQRYSWDSIRREYGNVYADCATHR